MRGFDVLLFGLAIILGGCGIKPVQSAGTPDRQCTAIAYPIGIDPPSTEGGFVEDRFQQAIDAAYASRGNESLVETPDEAVSDSMLYLSGGSQNGAFGAGLMSGWAAARTKGSGLPRFRVVTGISTGALQATYAFLDDTDEIVRRYSIEREGQLLEPLSRKGLKGDPLGGAITLARKGSIATLDPLRGQLHRLITPELLARVAREGRERRLLVGAVEMDSGEAVVFDLTAAAQDFVRTGNPAMRECYIEALIASSSVPMAAMPVFIDGRMYIDGGARFGVLAARLGKVLESQRGRAISPAVPNLFVLINGTLRIGPLCQLRDCEEHPPAPVNDGKVPQHGKWSFDALAFRSLSVLINQSYRSSVYYATSTAGEFGFVPRFARIESTLDDWPASVGLPPEPSAIKRCAQWEAEDNRIDAPLEFHPRFMRCLIDYGRHRPEAKAWAALE
jgi:hypothetical protein